MEAASFAYGPRRGRKKGGPGVIRRHAKAFAIGSALAVLTAAGGALALWLLPQGSGDAYTKAGAAQAVTTNVIASVDISEALLPSDTGDAFVSIHNPNDRAVTVTDIAQAGTPVDTNDGTCDLTGTVTLAATSGASFVVPANGDASFTLAGKVSTTAGFPSCVQGHRIAIPVTLDGTLG